MELATGRASGRSTGSRTAREIVLGHPKTREAMRAGLAMYFVTLEDDALMELGERDRRASSGSSTSSTSSSSAST